MRIGGRVGDVVRRHRPDYLILLYMGILMLIGLIVMYAIGPQRANVLNAAYGANYSDTYFFIKQAVSLVVALGAFAFMALVPYTFILKHSTKILVLGLGACLVLAISAALNLPFAQPINGATSWFSLGFLGTVQPAEFLKFGLVLYVAVFIGMRAKEGKVNDLKETLIPVGVISLISLFFVVVLQRDLGTGIAIAVIVTTMLFMAGVHKKYLAFVAVAVAIAGILLIAIAPHRVARVATFVQGDNAAAGDAGAYHIRQARIALGTGGFFGVGIGNSVQATGYLPEAINDSVFAILGETFGFVGLIALLAVLVALLLRLLKVLDHLVDIRLKLIAAGVFGWFGAHVILNIAAMIGIFPLTGITLPLLSAGGTSMVFIAAALGLVFQLSRYTIHGSRLKESTNENSGSGRRLGRTRYASRSGS